MVMEAFVVRRRDAALATVFGACLASASFPAAAASYTYTSLNIAGGNAVASGLDNKDRVVGTFTPKKGGNSEGVVWTDAQPTLVPAVRLLTAVSDSGIAAGRAVASKHKYVTYDLSTSKIKNYTDGTSVPIVAPVGINAGGTVLALGAARAGGDKPSGRYDQALYLSGNSGVVLEPPGFVFGAIPTGIGDNGVAGGAFDGGCFTYNAGSYTVFLPPDPSARMCYTVFINGAGSVFGTYEDDSNVQHGYLQVNGTYSLIDYPNATDTDITGVLPGGEVVGYYDIDTKGTYVTHGFLLIDGTFYQLDVPGEANTRILSINASGSLLLSTAAGYYLAQCASKKPCTQ